ncbi:MAG: hypothetical protein ACU83U_14205, partial [Gammaproteobacteria bacterium]
LKNAKAAYCAIFNLGRDKMMLKKLTTEAWLLYLKILNAEFIADLSMKNVDRQYKLADRAYYRYRRRRASDA